MLPRVTLEGNLCDEPELRFTNQGVAVASLRVACNDRKFNRQSGHWEDAGTTFLKVTVWKTQAENIVESTHRGDAVMVSGRLVQREWTDKDNQRHIEYQVTAEDIGVSTRMSPAPPQRVQRTQVQQQGQQQGQDQWATQGQYAQPSQQGQQQGQGQWQGQPQGQPQGQQGGWQGQPQGDENAPPF